MGLFDDEIEVDDALIDDAKELLEDMFSETQGVLEKNQMVYLNKYKRILRELNEELSGDFGSSRPRFLDKLFEDLEHPGAYMPTRAMDIKMIKLGLKKILRKFDVELPAKVLPPHVAKQAVPHIQQNFVQNQSMNNEISISVDVKIEIDQALKDFEEEMEKSNPSESKLRSLWEIVKKGAGYGALRLSEILMKRLMG